TTVDITIVDATPLTATFTQTPTLCSGGATGTVTITPAGGTGPYTITPAQTGLAAGLHTFTITDANGCTTTVDITIVDATPLTATFTQTPTLCSGGATGTVTITPAGGTGPYTITPAQTGLAAGLHTFTITDANGCTTTVDITIVDATPLTATFTQTPTLCSGGATGTVTITPAGGTGPYTITPAQTGLAAGLHTFTITDANGCTTTVDITIVDATPLTATFTQTPTLCSGGATGTVTIKPAGRAGPYTLTPAQTGLAPGLHTSTITDVYHLGCEGLHGDGGYHHRGCDAADGDVHPNADPVFWRGNGHGGDHARRGRRALYDHAGPDRPGGGLTYVYHHGCESLYDHGGYPHRGSAAADGDVHPNADPVFWRGNGHGDDHARRWHRTLYDHAGPDRPGGGLTYVYHHGCEWLYDHGGYHHRGCDAADGDVHPNADPVFWRGNGHGDDHARRWHRTLYDHAGPDRPGGGLTYVYHHGCEWLYDHGGYHHRGCDAADGDVHP